MSDQLTATIVETGPKGDEGEINPANYDAKASFHDNDKITGFDSENSDNPVTWLGSVIKSTFSTLFVDKTSNEAVGGVKSFSDFPITPASPPTSDYQVANKKYVDDNAGGGGGSVDDIDLMKWGGTLSPQKVIAYDFFQRADGALGNADSGQTWTAWDGTASISGNIASISGTHVLHVPSQGEGLSEWSRHLEGVISIETSVSFAGIVIGKDSSNYLKIAFSDRYIRLYSVIAGSQTLEFQKGIALGSYRRYMYTWPYITIYKQGSALRANIGEKFMGIGTDDEADDINLDGYSATFDQLPYIGFFGSGKKATGIRLTEMT